ncbi:MAG: hypothetical protein ACREOZ_04980, partial [Gloeomargaritales cyanobacterium]
LSWLSTLQFYPMPFRQSFYKKLRFRQRKIVHDLLEDVFQAYLASHSPPPASELPPHECQQHLTIQPTYPIRSSTDGT